MRAVPRAQLPEGVWNAFVDAHSDGWFWHREEWISYSLDYTDGSVDHSFGLVDVYGTLRAVVPLIQEGFGFSMGHHPCPDPLFILTSGDPCRLIDAHVSRIAHDAGVQRWSIRSGPLRDPEPVAQDGLLTWHDCSWSTFELDLHAEESVLWHGVRRSTRHLIRRARTSHLLFVSAQPESVEAARLLHEQAAGRPTRPLRTWARMTDWARDGHLITALAFPADDFETPEGMAIAIRYKNRAYYASGATVVKDLSHALVWTLTQTLRCGGLHFFELGWDVRDGDSEKDRSIAFFKSGFGAARRTISAWETTL